eukprot:211594_1
MAALERATPQKQNNMASSHRYVWCTGYNGKGEFGIGNDTAQNQFIKCHWSKNMQIRNIHVADEYTLVADNDGNYYSAGFNIRGACTVNDDALWILTMTAITCFKENNLKISQVFVNNKGDAPFWKTDNGSIYTSSSNTQDA